MDAIEIPKPLRTGYARACDGIDLYFQIYGPSDSKGMPASWVVQNTREGFVGVIAQQTVGHFVWYHINVQSSRGMRLALKMFELRSKPHSSAPQAKILCCPLSPCSFRKHFLVQLR